MAAWKIIDKAADYHSMYDGLNFALKSTSTKEQGGYLRTMQLVQETLGDENDEFGKRWRVVVVGHFFIILFRTEIDRLYFYTGCSDRRWVD